MVDLLTGFVSAIENLALGLYILSAGGILFMAYRLRQARHELALAQFKLEREHAQVKQANAVTFGGLLIEFMIGVWAIANVMAPTLRDIKLGTAGNDANRPDQFLTSTPAIGPAVALDVGPIIEDSDDIISTPPPTATFVGTIEPGAPEPVGCQRENAWFDIPANGQKLFEATTVRGVASVSNFAYYKFELKPAVEGAEFAPIGGNNIEVKTVGPLGEIQPQLFPPGDYRFRLAVFSNTNELRAVCEVTIHIIPPPVTPTPTPPITTPTPTP